MVLLKIPQFLSLFLDNFFFPLTVNSMGLLMCFVNFALFSMSWPSIQQCAVTADFFYLIYSCVSEVLFHSDIMFHWSDLCISCHSVQN